MKSSWPMTSMRMQRIKSRGTGLEKQFAMLLRKNGVKYESQPKTIGHPDFRIRGTNVLIFCDSSFWHGRRKSETSGKAFGANKRFWKTKLLYNKRRDVKITKLLKQRGWRVLRFWDDEILKHPALVLKQLNRYVKISK